MYYHYESYCIVRNNVPSQNDEEPLNSDDDVSDGDSDEEGGGDFETEDTIVCQWEKVYNMSPTLNYRYIYGMLYTLCRLN